MDDGSFLEGLQPLFESPRAVSKDSELPGVSGPRPRRLSATSRSPARSGSAAGTASRGCRSRSPAAQRMRGARAALSLYANISLSLSLCIYIYIYIYYVSISLSLYLYLYIYMFCLCCDSQSLPYPVARCLLWWAARIPTRVFEAVGRLTHSVTMPGREPGTSR